MEGSAIADDVITASFLDADLVSINTLQYVASPYRCDLQYHSYLPVRLVPACDSSSPVRSINAQFPPSGHRIERPVLLSGINEGFSKERGSFGELQWPNLGDSFCWSASSFAQESLRQGAAPHPNQWNV